MTTNNIAAGSSAIADSCKSQDTGSIEISYIRGRFILTLSPPEKKIFFWSNNEYRLIHTNLIVNVHICCLALLTIVVVNCGCLETNHDYTNIIIELAL